MSTALSLQSVAMSSKKSPSEKIGNVTPFGLRLLPELRARVEEAARKSKRSLNAEIVARLEASFSDMLSSDEDFTDVITEIDKLKARLIQKRTAAGNARKKSSALS
ncbi:Arc family DNA-binding protein [Rhizobium leguminosarum]|uniref:Arc family DNA-binding protein n=1 Tax=Rhizobium leguminosarum TaxID=384 RepID=UPI0019544177|nr:Arc family DNA-binding protein [Rhizobium leguminosarum]